MIHPEQINLQPSNGSAVSKHNSNRNGKLTYSGRHNPCPICGRTKDQDCRWNDEVVFCHVYRDQDAGISGYVYRGAVEIWGQYFPAKESEKKAVRPKSKREFIYNNAAGISLVRVTRNDKGDGSKSFYQYRWDGKTWVKGLTDEVKSQIHMYRIQDSINQDAITLGKPILIVEGEGKVDLLLQMGIAATCSIGGALKWRHYGHLNYLEDLAGANVVLCPDRDIKGVQHCENIARDFPNAAWLYAFPDSPLWERVPDKGGLDIADWIADGVTREQILGAIGKRRDLGSQIPAAEPSPEPKTIADMLLAIATNATYFHTSEGKAYADVTINRHRETYPVNSKPFKEWLRFQLYRRYCKTVGAETLASVLGVLEAKARYEGEEIRVYLRLAEYQGKVYLDLGGSDWTAVEISSDGWRIVSDYPIRFRRTKGMLPLCLPQQGGNVSELKQVLNLAEQDWALVLGWLSFCFYPVHPHPVLILHGEQGSGKSFTAQILKSLIDPGICPLQPEPRDMRDLAIAAHNRWLLCFDNLSNTSNWLSDALCRIATGGGFATRTLYEDEEETILEFTRPIILTGIDSLATRSDLLERSILVNLPTILEEQRLTEEVLNAKVKQIKPKVLGVILTAVSQILKTLPATNPGRLPRMADFAKWVIAGESALGLTPGSFLQAYGDNCVTANEIVLEADPLGQAIVQLLESKPVWEGTATELLAELESIVGERTAKSRAWIAAPNKISNRLTRLAPDLRAKGIRFYRPHRADKKGSRLLHLEKRCFLSSESSESSDESQNLDGEGN